MKILGFSRYNSGPCWHRIIMPLMHLETEVYITNQFNEEDFNGVDIVVYNRVLSDEAIKKVYKLREKLGFKICADLDDHWELDPHHILYQSYQETEYSKEQIYNIKNADLVTVTHERLAAEVIPFNKNVHVLPNAIKRAGQFDIEREPYHLTRLFWQGSDTHEQDIALLQRPIEALANISGKIKMVMSGWADSEVWDRMSSMYTAKYKHQYELIPFSHVKDYYRNYLKADICLIPLLNSPFNRMKSNLKVLEAANLGLPVICSNVHPYKDLPVLYANNSTDWVNHINKLVKSKKRQREAGQELKEFCDRHFNFDKINRERLQIFEHQISLA